jgi:predicted PurR-regulated permease PerM
MNINNYEFGISIIILFIALFLLGTFFLIIDSFVSKVSKTNKNVATETNKNNDLENFETDINEIDYSVDYDNLL